MVTRIFHKFKRDIHDIYIRSWRSSWSVEETEHGNKGHHGHAENERAGTGGLHHEHSASDSGSCIVVDEGEEKDDVDRLSDVELFLGDFVGFVLLVEDSCDRKNLEDGEDDSVIVDRCNIELIDSLGKWSDHKLADADEDECTCGTDFSQLDFSGSEAAMIFRECWLSDSTTFNWHLVWQKGGEGGEEGNHREALEAHDGVEEVAETLHPRI